MVLYLLIHCVTRNLKRLETRNSRKRNNRYLSNTSTDINNHFSFRLSNVKVHSNGCCEGLEDKVNCGSIELLEGRLKRTSLNVCCVVRHTGYDVLITI